MMILNRFLKPKWQHADPLVRKQAISNLNNQDPDQQKILQQLVNDHDPGVAQTAISKISDLVFLNQLLNDNDKKNIHPFVTQKIISVLTQTPSNSLSETAQTAFIHNCTNELILHAVAKTGLYVKVQLAAVHQINSEPVLADIVTQSQAPAVRIAAAEKIHTTDGLQQLSKQIRNRDKNVYRLIKERLTAQADEANKHQQNLDLCQHLVASIENLAHKAYFPQYPQKFALLQKQWSALDTRYRSQVLEERFQHASYTCVTLIEQEKKGEALEQERLDAQEEQVMACCVLEEGMVNFNETIKTEGLDIPVINALLKTQNIRWHTATETHPAPPELQQRYTKISQLLEQGLVAYQHLQSQEHHLLQLLADKKNITTLEKLHEALNVIDWPAGLASPPLLNKVQAMLGERKKILQSDKIDNKQKFNAMSTQLDQLKHALEEGALKSANKLYKDLNQPENQTLVSQNESLLQRFKQLGTTLKEMNDWQDFSSIQKKEELCQKMELLINSNSDPDDKAKQIKQLQEDWQHSGASDRKKAQALWQRFKDASDKAYEPCKDYFQQQSALRKKNLDAKQTICDQLQLFITENDWTRVNWKAVIEIVQTAKEQWKLYSLVDRAKGQEIQQQFNDLIAQLETRITAEKNRCREQKNTLILAVKALFEHSDLTEAIEKTKALQTQWKNIDTLSRKGDEALWQQFRTHCDAIFSRRTQAKRQAEHAQEIKIQHAQNLCLQLEDCANADPAKLIENNTLDVKLSKEFEALSPLPRDQDDALRKRFNKAKKLFNQQLRRAREQHTLNQLLTLRQLGQWLSIQETSARPADTNALSAHWQQQTATLPQNWLAPLSHRYIALSQSLPSLTPDEVQKDKELLCIRMEIAAGIESPQEYKSARMAYQVNRLAQGLQNSAEKALSPTELAIEIETKWIGLPDAQRADPLEQRFKKARDTLWQHVSSATQNQVFSEEK